MDKDELGANDRNKKAGEGKVSFKHGLGKFSPIYLEPGKMINRLPHKNKTVSEKNEGYQEEAHFKSYEIYDR